MSNVMRLPLSIPKQAKDEKFEEFWLSYPRRVGKPRAKAKWDAITNGGLLTQTFDRDSNSYVTIEICATPQELIDGAKRYYQQCRLTGVGAYGFKDEGRFICHPATWLNQGRWMDD